MRKRSKYKPKHRLLDPLGYVVESSQPLAEQHQKYVIDLKIKNHAAMFALTQANATQADMNCLIIMVNIMDAFRILGVTGVEAEIKTATGAIMDICARTPRAGKFIATGPEILALNTLMDYHDELFEHITVGQLEDAVKVVRRVISTKKATPLPEVSI